ncbi:MAG: hypothetical protein COS40_11545 [Deltaproteobacteria bacterium CG03_land_8_20_14_0_80_45_14]|nr:MAG: hypothetical protein COS40_11545 [Deltaproteobacteria bacterium CG03_land_8_20_14_0_80_45_14]
MQNKKRFMMIGVFATLTILTLLVNPLWADSKIYYGKVVGTEFNVIQVRDDHGRISWFWMGHRTHFESRVPFFGDRVRIEYVKDKLGRNAVTRIKVLR